MGEAMTEPSSGTHDTTTELIRGAEKQHLKPLWAKMAQLNSPLPNPKCIIPHVWEFEEIRPHLLKAGELITEKQVERRVLMLVNPARGTFGAEGEDENLTDTPQIKDAPYKTDTIYGGLQLVMPGETAPAHRHTAFAWLYRRPWPPYPHAERRRDPETVMELARPWKRWIRPHDLVGRTGPTQFCPLSVRRAFLSATVSCGGCWLCRITHRFSMGKDEGQFGCEDLERR